MTWDATIQSQGHFGSYTGELGQPRTKPWTDVGCACFTVHRDTKPLLTCLDIWDRFLKHSNVAWWDTKIRLLCHVAPQQKDFWDIGIISSSLSNLITFSRDGIGTYFVSCQSLISSKESVSPWLDFVSLSHGCVYIYNTSSSCEMSAQKIKHKEQLAKGACDQDYSRLSFSHKNKFITPATVMILSSPSLSQTFTCLSTSVHNWTKSSFNFQLQKKDSGRPNFKSNLRPWKTMYYFHSLSML